MRQQSIRMTAGLALGVSTIAMAAAPTCVLPLGDSITAGSEGGYRKPLMATLAKTVGTVTTVGSQTDASMPPGTQAHEGHGGWRLTQLADHLLGRPESEKDGGYWLTGGHDTGREAIHPTIITLMAGINDLNGMIPDDAGRPMSERSDEILSTLQTRLRRVVDELTETLPDATIYLGGCTPYANGLLNEKQTGATEANRKTWATQDGVAEVQELGVNHWVLAFDRWVRDVYVPELQKAGKHAAFVDLYAPFILPDGTVRAWDNNEPQKSHGPAGYADYGLHPNTFGYGLIADAWAKAITTRVGK